MAKLIIHLNWITKIFGQKSDLAISVYFENELKELSKPD